MKKTWVILFVLSFLLVGCSGIDEQVFNISKENNSEQSSKEEQDALLPYDFFSVEGIGEEAFANFCLSSFYDNPRNIDLEELFYNGFGMQVNDEDRCFIEEKRAEVEYDIIKLPVNEMNKILEKYLNITLAETNMVGTENFYYNKEDEVYYLLHTDCHVMKIKVLEQVMNEDGSIHIVYIIEGDNQKCIASLKKDGENYVFLSNQIYNE